MSRTYRRTKRSPEWVTHRTVFVYQGIKRKRKVTGEYDPYQCPSNKFEYKIYTNVDVPRSGKDLKKHIKKYRADKNQGYYSPPSDFVNRCINKPFRARMKQEVIKVTKLADDYLDYEFEPYRKTAGWSWW